jgi:hypothetical protein
MQPGASVHILPPFADAFPGTFTVREVGTASDGQTVVFLVGVESAFSPCFLEVTQ